MKNKIAFTKEELENLSDAIGMAVVKYQNAVSDTLEVRGKEYRVLSDDDEEDYLSLNIIGKHGEVYLGIDKVRYNKEKHAVECHVCEEDYSESDYWMYASSLGSDIDYVYNNIDWDE